MTSERDRGTPTHRSLGHPDGLQAIASTQASSMQPSHNSDSPSRRLQGEDTLYDKRDPWNAELWGYLEPLNSRSLARIDFRRDQARYTFGRDRRNHVVLPGLSVSGRHCEIEWNRGDGSWSAVVVKDFSRNGTIVSGLAVQRLPRYLELMLLIL